MARYMPEILEKEWERLLKLHYSLCPDEGDEEISAEEANRPLTEEEKKQINEEFDQFIRENGSEELWAYLQYCKRVGDEAQICDEDGNYIRDKNGFYIQDWSGTEDGYVINNITGELVRDRNGNLVSFPVLDERVKKLYRDEGWEFDSD